LIKTLITYKNHSVLENNKTTTAKALAEAIDTGVKAMFTGKITLPLNAVIGHSIAELNRKGLVTNNVLDSFNMDAGYAETKHSKLLNTLVGHAMHAAARYGDIAKSVNKVNNSWVTHWLLVLNDDIFMLLDHEVKSYVPVTVKKLRKAKLQTKLTNSIGVSTDVEGLDAEYLQALQNQHVEFIVNETELDRALQTAYCESEPLMNGSIRYSKTLRTDRQIDAHKANIKSLSGKMLPIMEKLETRGRTAKQLHSKLGLNLYGKTWETQSFRLGDETVAYDARQSGYQIMSGLLGVKPIAKISGIYGKQGLGDLYTDLFMVALEQTFGIDMIAKLGKKAAREVAKRPAQMLAYMAGMTAILTNETKDFGSIWSHLGNDTLSIDLMCVELEKALHAIPELEPIMELRKAVRDGHRENKAIPSWRLPESSLYHFTRSDTSYIGDRGVKSTPVFTFVDDAGKTHNASMHIEMFREKAKYSAILAAIIHSIDGWIKKKVTLDVINAGGKCLVKHDEFIVDKEHEEIMIKSYHKWMAYVASHRYEFLQKPLKDCGYIVNQKAMVDRNEKRFGKFNAFMVSNAVNGLKFEWQV